MGVWDSCHTFRQTYVPPSGATPAAAAAHLAARATAGAPARPGRLAGGAHTHALRPACHRQRSAPLALAARRAAAGVGASGAGDLGESAAKVIQASGLGPRASGLGARAKRSDRSRLAELHDLREAQRVAERLGFVAL